MQCLFVGDKIWLQCNSSHLIQIKSVYWDYQENNKKLIWFSKASDPPLNPAPAPLPAPPLPLISPLPPPLPSSPLSEGSLCPLLDQSWQVLITGQLMSFLWNELWNFETTSLRLLTYCRWAMEDKEVGSEMKWDEVQHQSTWHTLACRRLI